MTTIYAYMTDAGLLSLRFSGDCLVGWVFVFDGQMPGDELGSTLLWPSAESALRAVIERRTGLAKWDQQPLPNSCPASLEHWVAMQEYDGPPLGSLSTRD